MATANQSAFDMSLDALSIHQGATDQTMITTQPPSKVMTRVSAVLHEMGFGIQEKSSFKYRCTTVKKDQAAEDTSPLPSPGLANNASYGSPSDDSADEVRFSVELTKIAGLNGTYILDIRRLRGSLTRYKVIYDTIRNKLELNR
ncbi:hypothetical protein M413DRAFT_140977 [Hebeloma cylindrosporum]|uniref:non-specific serine/threonine protein kinase n=1 Tax=Hebeloma cylindrosporum TaxID=76867 RepID=A0A0C2XW71_HEBCY|nr:hypothetical protein M413DRAFT_140977 [Hebeloma cylindrosporum h7]